MSISFVTPPTVQLSPAVRPLPRKLWQCQDFGEQVRWVEAALNAGKTLSDPGLFLGGADPDAIIRRLRKAGLAIKTVHVPTRDADGELHRSVAWRLFKEDEPRPAPRKRASTVPAGQAQPTA